jgi:biotin transport system substrate-specific component
MFLGLAGLQIFTGAGSGGIYLLGPTGGYIAGFVLAAFAAGSLFSAGKQSLAVVFIKFLAADFIILASGALWLKISLALSWDKAFLLGFLPFVPGDIFKTALAAIVYRRMQARFRSILD